MTTKRRRDVLEDFANSLTSEEYIALLQIVYPLTDEDRAMTEDDLLAALTEDGA